jgi:flagellar biogenesis protein FliO
MELGRQYLGVAVVLGLLAATLWWLRRRGLSTWPAARRGGRRLESLERLPLSPQHTLHLIRAGESVVLLACSPGQCAVLWTMPRAQAEGLSEGDRL